MKDITPLFTQVNDAFALQDKRIEALEAELKAKKPVDKKKKV